jgi:arsenate reductase
VRPTLYGIPNCNSVKAAIAWLREHDVGYEFHDYKKRGAPQELLAGWVQRTDWERLLNRSGTTWRKLDEAAKASVVDASGAIALMSRAPTVIRRPVLEYNRTLLVGFDAEAYSRLLQPPQ